MAFAAIWEDWLGAEGSEIDTAAILTTRANALMRQIHDRMPVIIAPEDWSDWLDSANHRPTDVAHLLHPADDEELEAVPVSERVNSVRNDDENLVAPLAEPLVVDKPERPQQGELF
jgi:putative SOS response-associated peptidase YedK